MRSIGLTGESNLAGRTALLLQVIVPLDGLQGRRSVFLEETRVSSGGLRLSNSRSHLCGGVASHLESFARGMVW